MDVEESQELYTRCSLCNGSGQLPHAARVNTGGYTHVCPCQRSSTPGFTPVGVTMGQLMRMIEKRNQQRMQRAAVAAV